MFGTARCQGVARGRFHSGGLNNNSFVLSLSEGRVRKPALTWFDKLTTNGNRMLLITQRKRSRESVENCNAEGCPLLCV